jgi:hypothetical protein
MKNDLDELLQKQMDRRDFLKHVAIGFVALTGISVVVKTLNTLSGAKRQTSGYGASVYGGRTPKSPKQ